jgi:hypothetical protein
VRATADAAADTARREKHARKQDRKAQLGRSHSGRRSPSHRRSPSSSAQPVALKSGLQSPHSDSPTFEESPRTQREFDDIQSDAAAMGLGAAGAPSASSTTSSQTQGDTHALGLGADSPGNNKTLVALTALQAQWIVAQQDMLMNSARFGMARTPRPSSVLGYVAWELMTPDGRLYDRVHTRAALSLKACTAVCVGSRSVCAASCPGRRALAEAVAGSHATFPGGAAVVMLAVYGSHPARTTAPSPLDHCGLRH